MSIGERYAAIVAGLSEAEVAAVWAATMFGRTPLDERLRDRVGQLAALRNDVGRESVTRNGNGRSDAA